MINPLSSRFSVTRLTLEQSSPLQNFILKRWRFSVHVCARARVLYLSTALSKRVLPVYQTNGQKLGQNELFSSFLGGEETLPAPSLRKEARTLLLWCTLSTHTLHRVCHHFSVEQQVLKSLNNVLIPLRRTEIRRNVERLEAPDAAGSCWLPVPLPVLELDGAADILAWQSGINYTDTHTR